MKQLTFLFIVRLDSIERLENILSVTEFLNSNIDAQISVLECAPNNSNLLEKLLAKNILYNFIEDHDPILYRTRFINLMTTTVKTPFIAIWDADVLVNYAQILKALEILRTEEADFVYPYEKQFLDTSPILRKLFQQEGKIEVLEQNAKKMKELYLPNPVGGAFMASLAAYKKAGLENENFYGWGMEDGERFYRWRNMGYRIKRVPGPLFHLSHGRGLNSIYQNADQQFFKRKEVVNVRRNNTINAQECNDEQFLNQMH